MIDGRPVVVVIEENVRLQNGARNPFSLGVAMLRVCVGQFSSLAQSIPPEPPANQTEAHNRAR